MMCGFYIGNFLWPIIFKKKKVEVIKYPDFKEDRIVLLLRTYVGVGKENKDLNYSAYVKVIEINRFSNGFSMVMPIEVVKSRATNGEVSLEDVCKIDGVEFLVETSKLIWPKAVLITNLKQYKDAISKNINNTKETEISPNEIEFALNAILDKISTYGKESLTQEELDFLNKYSQK